MVMTILHEIEVTGEKGIIKCQELEKKIKKNFWKIKYYFIRKV